MAILQKGWDFFIKQSCRNKTKLQKQNKAQNSHKVGKKTKPSLWKQTWYCENLK